MGRARHAHAGEDHGGRRRRYQAPGDVARDDSGDPALNDHPVVAQILATRARAIGKDPAYEAVVIVAHGPNEEDDNRRGSLTCVRSRGSSSRREYRLGRLLDRS